MPHRMQKWAQNVIFCGGPLKCIAEKCTVTTKGHVLQGPTEVHCREAHPSKVAASRRLAFQTLLHFATLLQAKIPLVSFLALRSVLQNTFIRDMSIQARFCTLQADSGFQSVLFEESVQPPSSRLAPADRYSALWGIVAFVGESYADVTFVP
eukprot:s5106_g5.t1